MSDELLTVYEAPNLAEAEMIHQRLEDAEIEAWVDQTASPLDGLDSMGGQGTPVMVREEDAEQARQIIDRFLEEQNPETDTPDDV